MQIYHTARLETSELCQRQTHSEEIQGVVEDGLHEKGTLDAGFTACRVDHYCRRYKVEDHAGSFRKDCAAAIGLTVGFPYQFGRG